MKNDLKSVIQKLSHHGYQFSSVFDIGANKGLWTQEYEKEIPTAIFTLFEANNKWKKPKNISSKHNWINAVLSSPDQKSVSFYSKKGTGDSYYKEDSIAYEHISPIEKSTITLDQISKERKLPNPQLIKLDTQGSEIDILLGATQALSHAYVIQIETPILPYNKDAPNLQDYLFFMIDHNFIPIGVDDIHLNNNILMQLDVVFVQKEIKHKFYGDKVFWKGLNK